MSETKTFVFPEGCGGNGNTLDPNMLFAMMNNGGFGGNGNWLWVIFLFFLNGWGRGGNWFGGGNDCNCADRELLMSAIQGNGQAVGQLATTLNCDINAVQTAINSVQSAIQSVGNQVGLTGQQIINAIQSGNMSLASQLSQCCCDNKLLACQNHGAVMSRIDQLANGITQGFSATAYETAQQTCALQNGLRDQTQTILNKLSSMESNAKDEKIQTLTTELSNIKQNGVFAAMLAPLQSELAAIKAAQPATTTVQYPQLTAIPTAQLYGFGGGYGIGQAGFWG